MESPAKRSRKSHVIFALCWIYLLVLGGLVFYLRNSGDRSWLATILIFSPRWIFAAPIVLLSPSMVYRRCWLPMGLLIITALFPLMGLSIGWHRFGGGKENDGQAIRIVTFNLHHIEMNAPGFRDYLESVHADVLAFEEMPGRASRRDFPAGLTHTARHGELCIASRFPIHTIRIIKEEVAIRYTLDTPTGPVDFIGVHLSSPHWALRDSIDGSEQGPDELARNISNRREEAELLRAEIQKTTNRPLVIAGDFNLAPDSPLFLQNFSTMSDAFDSIGLGFGWTYYHQHTMVRIDHVVANDFVRFKACAVGPFMGSPHRSVVVDMVLSNP